MFLVTGVLKICSKFTGERSNFIEITLRCFPVDFLHIFRTPFTKDTSGVLLLTKVYKTVYILELTLNVIFYHCHSPRLNLIPIQY